MTVTEATMFTVEDYQLLPETGPRYQVVEGELCMAPAPNRYHQDISRNLEFLLLKYLEKHPHGKLYHAPFDVYLDKYNVFQPDILFVSNERLALLSDRGAEGGPNLVIEILSTRTAELDRETKRKVYARTGVEGLWIIDPWKQTIDVYYLQKDAAKPAAVYKVKDTFTSPQFPDLKISATEIFKR
jgi:Uma2 family endonuclease